MSCERFQTVLDDHVDGVLDAEARREVEAHLDRCATCRTTERELRELLRAAEELPGEIEPGRDLLPGIRAAVGVSATTAPTSRVGVPSTGSASWTRWAGLAASLLVLSAAVITYLRLGNGENAPGVPRPSGDTVAARFEASNPYRAAEEEYLAATRQLLAVIEERREHLSPETLAVLDRNLAIIDKAIHEVRAALAADPGDPGSELVLNAMYQQKIELLRRVSRLSS
jgi:anti-sigma factor RsiW